MSLYSTRFALVSGQQTYTYTIPAGKRAVIKCVSAFNASASAQQFLVFIENLLIYVANLPTNQPATAAGLQVVINAGETLKVIAGPSVTGQVSGYLLATG